MTGFNTQSPDGFRMWSTNIMHAASSAIQGRCAVITATNEDRYTEGTLVSGIGRPDWVLLDG